MNKIWVKNYIETIQEKADTAREMAEALGNDELKGLIIDISLASEGIRTELDKNKSLGTTGGKR